MTDARAAVGRSGEDAAAAHLVAQGYRVLARNWACPPIGELDIVVCRANVLVFVEVRSVSTRFLSSPTLTVQPAKQRKVARAADRYLARHRADWDGIRFDVVGVQFRLGRAALIEHIENAFVPDWSF